jgi:hypothetical protein
MAFLFAHCADGSLSYFEKAELAFFFPNSPEKLYVQGGRKFAKSEIIVFGQLKWFKGTVDIHDYAYDSPIANAIGSTRFPTAQHAKLELPLPPTGTHVVAQSVLASLSHYGNFGVRLLRLPAEWPFCRDH